MLYVVARWCNSSGYLLAKFFGRRRLCIDQEQCTYQSQTARKGYRNRLNFNGTQRNVFREFKIANPPLLTLGASLYTNRRGHGHRHMAARQPCRSRQDDCLAISNQPKRGGTFLRDHRRHSFAQRRIDLKKVCGYLTYAWRTWTLITGWIYALGSRE